jgi:hypothetical protein
MNAHQCRLVVLVMALVLGIAMGIPGISGAMRGDVNGDTTVNVFDALLVLQYAVGLYHPSDETLFTSTADVAPLDVNGLPRGDGKINVFDALAVLRNAVNLDTWTLPTGCAATLKANPSAASGVYFVDPDGDGSFPEMSVYCEKTGAEVGAVGNGGWLLLARDTGTTFDMPYQDFANATSLWLGNLGVREGLLSASPEVLSLLAPEGKSRILIGGNGFEDKVWENGNFVYEGGYSRYGARGESGNLYFFYNYLTSANAGVITQFGTYDFGGCPSLLNSTGSVFTTFSEGTAGLGDYNYHNGNGCWGKPSTGPTSGEIWVK